MLDPMKFFSQHLFSVIFIVSLFALTACERETYTTWGCKNSSGEKSPMILKKAQMQFQEKTYHYCGSLGSQSFFDSSCSTTIESSQNIFTPSTGLLTSNSMEYHCDAL